MHVRVCARTRACAHVCALLVGGERYSCPNAALDDVTMMSRRNVACAYVSPTDEEIDTDLGAAGV